MVLFPVYKVEVLLHPWHLPACSQVLGVPSTAEWPEMTELAHQMEFKPCKGKPLADVFPHVGAYVMLEQIHINLPLGLTSRAYLALVVA
jgi:hypothetical protein